ncbi:hypothetical protein [Mesorhizobium australicum]|uniref:hypothetical protein n=1 Tax=Mesorhizobium australicum TaxID=536018 RepID=UPI00333C33AF
MVDLNPPAPSELRDHARSVPPAPAGPAFARAEETSSAVGEAAQAASLARLQKQMDEPVHDPGPLVDTSPWEAQLMMLGSGQEHAAAPYAGGSGSMLGASVLQPGHSTARHHDAPDSSVVDLNPPAPFELRDHARSVPAAVQPDPPIGVSGRDKRPLYTNDATIVEGLRSALESTVKRNVNSLLGFGRWLFDNNRPGFAARLHEESLDPDLKEYESKSGSSDVARAVGHLKTWAGGAPVLDRAAVLNNPDPADAALIRDYTAAPIKEYKAAPTGPNPKTIQDYAVTPRRFSEYLVENNKPGIAARLHEGSLDEDAKHYNNSGGISALAHLRRFPPYAEPGREIALAARPEDAVGMEARAVGDAAVQRSGPQEALGRPENLSPGEANEGDAVVASSFVPTGHHHQASDPAESFRPLIWRDGDQHAPDERIAAQDRSNQLSSEEVLIHREHDTAELRPAKRQSPLNSRLQDVATEPQLSEIGNSGARVLMQAPTHQVGALPWEAQPMMQGSGQEHAAAPHTGGSGSMLGASVLQPGHSTARHHDAPDSSLVDLNPPAPFELRDHARSVPAAVQPDPPIGVSGRDKRPLYSNDATLVEGLRSSLYAGKVGEITVKRHVDLLFGFGHWLVENNKPGIADRLHDSSLDRDRKEYESRGGPSAVAGSLGRLKTWAGGAPVVGRPALKPDPADAALIREYTAALIKEYKGAPATGPKPRTVEVYGSALRRFSQCLVENKKPGIADRLHERSLDEDAKRYMKTADISALAHLRKFAPGREIALAARPEDAVGMEARAIGDAAAQTAAQAHGHAGEQGPISRAQQVAPAPFERHLGKKREAQDGLTSTLDGSNLVNSGGVIINNEHEHYTALLIPAKRQRTDNPQSRTMGRQLSEATTTSISQASDQARADLMASFRSRERSDAGR